MNKKFGFLLFAGLSLAFLILACGGESEKTPTVSSVEVSPETCNVVKGGTETFTVKVTGENNPAQTVTWTVTGGAAGTGITEDGVLTVAAGETAETLTVTATSTVDASKSDTATVTVSPAPPQALAGTVTITGIQVLTANTTDLTNISGDISYQWARGDSAAGTFADLHVISKTYTLAAADNGKYIRVTVATSGNTGNVSATAGPIKTSETWTNADLNSGFQRIGKNGAYDVEMWNRDKQGTASMTLGVNGAYKCAWDGIYNVLFRVGRKYEGSNRKKHSDIGVFSIDYDATISLPGGSGKRNAYISVYGWVTRGTPDDLIEYYIVDYFGEYNPKNSTGAVKKGEITINGEGTYEIFEVPNNGPTIEGNKDFKQYFSIRTATRTSGTISVSKHFEAWAANGMTSINTGNLTEVTLKVESFGSTAGNAIGTAEVTKNILKINGVPIQ